MESSSFRQSERSAAQSNRNDRESLERIHTFSLKDNTNEGEAPDAEEDNNRNNSQR
jgi:hypothetical protein